MGDNVFTELSNVRFSSLSYIDKQRILNNGRPTPDLNISKENKAFTRKFHLKLYNDVEWLCGNISNNKLYCWPCFLFSKENGVWNSVSRGYDDLNNLHTAMTRHEKSFAHMSAYVAFKTFWGKSNRTDLLPDRQKTVVIRKHNEKVSQNREILKRFIRMTCFLGMQELSFQGHSDDNSDNEGNYIEIANCMADFDEKFYNHLQTGTVFEGTSSTIQNELIESISGVILNQIKMELTDCKYVAILLDETSELSCLSQLSMVVRYVDKDGEIWERFIKFSDVSKDRSAQAISDLVTKRLEELGCLEKLVAQTYDGAAVMGRDLYGVEAKVKEIVPEAIFLHCYANKLNLVLIQAVSEISECNIFFSVLGSLSSFFIDSGVQTSVINEIVENNFPNLVPTMWSYSSCIVKLVKENDEDLMNLFNHILENPKQFDGEIQNSARGLLAGIDTFQFSFFLEVFSLIFPFTEHLFNVLQVKSIDVAYSLITIESTIEKIEQIKDTKFEDIWDLILEKYVAPPKKRKMNLSPEAHYNKIFYEIFDIIIIQIKQRFRSIQKLEFIELVDCEKFKFFDSTFPEKAFESLKVSYNSIFDFSRLRSELYVLYSHKCFAKNTVNELLKYLMESEMQEVLQQVYKLLTLVLTLPISIPKDVEGSFSALDRIKTYLRNSKCQEKSSSLALIAIEKVYLKKLMENRDQFYSLVIDEFCKKTCRTEFQFL